MASSIADHAFLGRGFESRHPPRLVIKFYDFPHVKFKKRPAEKYSLRYTQEMKPQPVSVPMFPHSETRARQLLCGHKLRHRDRHLQIQQDPAACRGPTHLAVYRAIPPRRECPIKRRCSLFRADAKKHENWTEKSCPAASATLNPYYTIVNRSVVVLVVK